MTEKDLEIQELRAELEQYKVLFNEVTILKWAGQILGTTPEHLRELAEAEKDGYEADIRGD